MKCYLDTSAIVKMYHPETGYAYMGSIYDGGGVIQLSELGRLELVSAMRRKQRAGIVSEVGVSAALRRFSADLRSRYEMFTFTAPVVEDAYRIYIGGIGRCDPASHA